MKRLVCLVVGLILISVFSLSSASDFSLRNGIQFGDDIDTVKSKESFELEYSDEKNRLFVLDVTIGGIKDISLSYYFDKADKLNEVNWVCGDYFVEKDSKDTYKKLRDALVEKYGQSLKLQNGKHYKFTGSAIDAAEDFVAYFKSKTIQRESGIDGYDEWDVEITKDIHVKIDLVRFHGYMSFKGVYWRVCLSYDYYSVSKNAVLENEKVNELKNSI